MFIKSSWLKDFSDGEATIRESALVRRNTVCYFQIWEILENKTENIQQSGRWI